MSTKAHHRERMSVPCTSGDNPVRKGFRTRCPCRIPGGNRSDLACRIDLEIIP